MDALERRYHKRHLESADAELERVDEKLTLALRDLADDAASEDTQHYVATAIGFIAFARHELDQALKQLPRPLGLEAVEGHSK